MQQEATVVVSQDIAADPCLKDYSVIPVIGKKPIEPGWTRYCHEKRDYQDSDLEGGHNLGIACGPASGLLVLDIDDHRLFEDACEKNDWIIPETKTIRTGSGGHHYYFEYPETDEGVTYGNKSCKKEGFDIRGDGGVVVAAGSIHPDTGEFYTVELDCPVVPAPDWLLSLASKSDELDRTSDATTIDTPAEPVDLSSISISSRIRELILCGKPEGERSEAIFSVLNALVKAGLSNGQIRHVFEIYPVGQKCQEKGDLGWSWMVPQIDKVRESIGPLLESKEIHKALAENEAGDARLFAQTFEGSFCFDHSVERWHKWRGAYWEEDRIGDALDSVKAVAKQYEMEAQRLQYGYLPDGFEGSQIDKEKTIDSLKSRSKALNTLQRRKSVLTLAASGSQGLGVSGQLWDKNPWILGCSNGVIDLMSGRFREANPEDYLKTVAPVDWKGLEEPAPRFEKFIDEVFNGNEELKEFVHRFFGFSLIGIPLQHVFGILWGRGRNGKGTLLEILKSVLGDLASPIPVETLMKQSSTNSGASHTADLMILRGKRLAWASESDDGCNLDVAKVKRMVGGDTITARPPYGKRFITFDPSHTLFLLTNYRPKVSADDFALWQRVMLIPFELSFVPNPSDSNDRPVDLGLMEKLKAEASGILAWLVRGCRKWQEAGGLNPPESVIAATKQYKEDVDVMGRFIEETCEEAPDARVKAQDLYDAYRKWCEVNGHYPCSSTLFGKKMGDRYDKKKSGGIKYLGIRLISSNDDVPTDDVPTDESVSEEDEF